MDGQTLERWVDGYVRAWASNDPGEIGALFTEDALYATAPFREPRRGRVGIVEGWLERADAPGRWTFRSEIVAVAGAVGFVRGWTRSEDPATEVSNLWVVRLVPDARCAEFTEWWMEHHSGRGSEMRCPSSPLPALARFFRTVARTRRGRLRWGADCGLNR